MKAKFNESNRLLFAKGLGVWYRNNWYVIWGFIAVVFLCFFLVGYFLFHTLDTYKKGFNDGIKHATNVVFPSEELEIACASLWVNEQNQKYQQRQK